MFEGISVNVERYMNLLAQRQKLVVSNIANAETPGYKAKDIDFQSELQSQLAGVAPRVQEVSGTPVKNDGNNVSLDREARLLAENSLRFSIASNLLRGDIRSLRSAIHEGNSQ